MLFFVDFVFLASEQNMATTLTMDAQWTQGLF